MDQPRHSTTQFLDDFRTAQISHLLTAAVAGFDIGRTLQHGPRTFDELCREFKLKRRPAIVLLTALRSIDLIDVDRVGGILLTDYGREKMAPDSPFHLRGYIELGASSADVQAMIECLRHDRPAGSVSFVYHEGRTSALDDPQTADLLTRAMADRARNVAPLLAEQLRLDGMQRLIDVGGGHGLYSYALLDRHPELEAVIVDREPALGVARQFANQAGLAERVRFVCGDIHSMAIPADADGVLMANILHDYSEEHAASLVQRFAQALPLDGRLMILDSFLNRVSEGDPPVSDGPRAVAGYSALLFSICEGRCYRFDEAENWLRQAGLSVSESSIPLPAHGTLLTGVKH